MNPLQTGVRTTPEGLLILIDILTNGTPDEDDTGRDPTEEEMDAWLESLADDGGEE